MIDSTLPTIEMQQVPPSQNHNKNEASLEELLKEIEKLHEEKRELVEETEKQKGWLRKKEKLLKQGKSFASRRMNSISQKSQLQLMRSNSLASHKIRETDIEASMPVLLCHKGCKILHGPTPTKQSPYPSIMALPIRDNS